MLNSLKITNYRSFRNAELRLGESVVALVGKNGVGKTNLLHGIQAAAELCVRHSESPYSRHAPAIDAPATIELGFTIAENRYIYSNTSTSSNQDTQSPISTESLSKNGSTLFQRNGESISVANASVPNNIRIGARAAGLPTLLQILPQDDPAAIELLPVSKYLSAVQYYPFPNDFAEHLPDRYQPFIELSRYETWKSELAQGRPPRSVLMRILHMHIAEPAKLDELKLMIGANGLGIIADIRVEEVTLSVRKPPRERPDESSEKVYMITFKPGEGLAGADRWFRHNGLSAGTWRVLQLLTYLVFDANSCMLLEQPEDSIHSGLLAKVIDILDVYSDRTQLICTTHSPCVMNLIEPQGIRMVTATNGRSSVAELTPQRIESAKRYLEDDGTLSEFLETL